MDYIYDLAENTLTPQGVSSSGVSVKWRSREPVRIAFRRAGVQELLPDDSALALYLSRSGTLLAEVVTWTVPESDAGWYEGTLILHTAPLTTAFTPATVKSLMVGAELHWSAPGQASTPAVSDNLLSIQIQRPLVMPEPASPATLTGAEEWLSARAVRYDVEQTLSSDELAQARANFGITVTNDEVRILCPDGVTRRATLSDLAA